MVSKELPSEIQKADKEKKKKAYLLVAFVAIFAIFIQTDLFSSLFTVDKAGMDSNELLEAHLHGWKNALLFNAALLVVSGFLAIKLFIIGRRILKDDRFPPYKSKVAVDTKVRYGRKARIQAYMAFIAAFLLLLNPIFRTYSLYSVYSTVEEIVKTSAETSRIVAGFQDDFIASNPNDPQTAYYLYQQGEIHKAKELIELLVENGMEEAIYAKHMLNIDEKLYHFNKDESVDVIKSLCLGYIQPCLFLANYFIELRSFNEAMSTLNKIKHIEHPETYSKLLWLYSVSSWEGYDKEKIDHYAKIINKAEKPDCRNCTQFSLTPY